MKGTNTSPVLVGKRQKVLSVKSQSAELVTDDQEYRTEDKWKEYIAITYIKCLEQNFRTDEGHYSPNIIYKHPVVNVAGWTIFSMLSTVARTIISRVDVENWEATFAQNESNCLIMSLKLQLKVTLGLVGIAIGPVIVLQDSKVVVSNYQTFTQWRIESIETNPIMKSGIIERSLSSPFIKVVQYMSPVILVSLYNSVVFIDYCLRSLPDNYQILLSTFDIPSLLSGVAVYLLTMRITIFYMDSFKRISSTLDKFAPSSMKKIIFSFEPPSFLHRLRKLF